MAVWSDSVAKYILDFVNYGIIVVFIMIAWEIWSLISKRGGESAQSAGESTGGKIANWWKKRKGRALTRDLNEYIEDKKELDLIDQINDKIINAQGIVEGVVNSNQLTKEDAESISSYIKKDGFIDGAISDAIEELRKIEKRQTWRQEKAMGELIKKMKEQGLDASQVEAIENQILKKHREAREALQTAQRFVSSKISPFSSNLNTLISGSVTWPIQGAKSGIQVLGVNVGVVIASLNKNLRDKTFTGQIQLAESLQKDAIKDVQGIIVEMRNLAKSK